MDSSYFPAYGLLGETLEQQGDLAGGGGSAPHRDSTRWQFMARSRSRSRLREVRSHRARRARFSPIFSRGATTSHHMGSPRCMRPWGTRIAPSHSWIRRSTTTARTWPCSRSTPVWMHYAPIRASMPCTGASGFPLVVAKCASPARSLGATRPRAQDERPQGAMLPKYARFTRCLARRGSGAFRTVAAPGRRRPHCYRPGSFTRIRHDWQLPDHPQAR